MPKYLFLTGTNTDVGKTFIGTKLIKDLNDIDNYEKFARENFYMKKDDEEIYIIEYKDTIKN